MAKNNGNKEDNIERSIFLIKHVGACKDNVNCDEGEGCKKCKSVMAHFWNCSVNGRRDDCSVCRQVEALCKIHSFNCKSAKASCTVPFCSNTRVRSPPGVTGDEYKLVIRRLEDISKMPQASASQRAERKEKLEQFFVIQPWTSELLRHLYSLKQSKRNQNVKQPQGNTSVSPTDYDRQSQTDVIKQINRRMKYLSL